MVTITSQAYPSDDKFNEYGNLQTLDARAWYDEGCCIFVLFLFFS